MCCFCFISLRFVSVSFYLALCFLRIVRCGSAPQKSRCIYVQFMNSTHTRDRSLSNQQQQQTFIALRYYCDCGCGCVCMHYFSSHLPLYVFEEQANERVTHTHTIAQWENISYVWFFLTQYVLSLTLCPVLLLAYTFDFFSSLFSELADCVCMCVYVYMNVEYVYVFSVIVNRCHSDGLSLFYTHYMNARARARMSAPPCSFFSSLLFFVFE